MALAVLLQMYVWTCLLSCKGQARTRNPPVARPVQPDWQAKVVSCQLGCDGTMMRYFLPPQAAVQRWSLVHILNCPSSWIMRKTKCACVLHFLSRILHGVFYAVTQHITEQWEIPERGKMVLLDSNSSMPKRSRTVQWEEIQPERQRGTRVSS